MKAGNNTDGTHVFRTGVASTKSVVALTREVLEACRVRVWPQSPPERRFVFAGGKGRRAPEATPLYPPSCSAPQDRIRVHRKHGTSRTASTSCNQNPVWPLLTFKTTTDEGASSGVPCPPFIQMIRSGTVVLTQGIRELESPMTHGKQDGSWEAARSDTKKS